MADIKQVKVDNTTYNIKDEVAREQLATKQPLIESVSSTYAENGGSPSAVASTDESGNLAFNFQNLKLKFSDLTAGEKESIKGPQGTSAVFDPETGNILATLENTTGQSTSNAMTQKAVTDLDLDGKIMQSSEISDIAVFDYALLDTGKYGTNNSFKHCCLRVHAGEKYIIDSINSTTRYAFATTYISSSGDDVPLVADTSVVTLGIGKEIVTIPSGASYLIINNYVNSTLFKLYKYTGGEKFADIDDKISSISSLFETDTKRANPVSASFPYIASGGIYTAATSYFGANYLDNSYTVKHRGYTMRLVPQDGSYVRYAFVKNKPVGGDTVVYCDGYSGVNGTEVAINKTVEVVIPDDAEYVWVQMLRGGVDISPQSITFFQKKGIQDALNYVDEVTEDLRSIQESMVVNGYCGNKTETIVPSVSDTYNAYYRASYKTNCFQPNTKRLLYFPKVFVKGGEDVVVRYSGLNQIRVFQFKYLPLDYNLVNTNYKIDDIIDLSIYLPSSGSSSYTGEVTFRLDKNTKRIAFVMGATKDVTVSVQEITDNITEIDMPIMDTSKLDISSLAEKISENDTAYDNLIRQAMYVADSPTIPSMGLLHFTDIHGDQEAAIAINEFRKKYLNYINDTICTGDSVLYYADETSTYPQAAGWWNEDSGLADKSLFVLGNHDGATPNSVSGFDDKEGSAAWDGKGQQWAYETYIEPYISTLGYQMSEGESYPCYWHKDYPSKKIRIIGLDCMHRCDGIVSFDAQGNAVVMGGMKRNTAEQEEWLWRKLEETTTANDAAYGYAVIIFCHYGLDEFNGRNEQWDDSTHKWIYNQNENGGVVMSGKTSTRVNFHTSSNGFSIDKRFSLRNRVPNERAEYNYDKGDANNFGDIIQGWIGRHSDAHFVAWFAGHSHRDYMYYPTNYPDILNIVCDQAGCIRGTDTGDRSKEYSSRTCANFYAIDTQNHLIKIVRLGFTMNRWLNSHKYLCYNYDTRVVINEG